MKKREFGILILGLVLAILMMGFVAAANETAGEASNIEKAYKCLEEQIKSKTKLSLQEAAFSMMAIGEKNEKISTGIEAEKKESEACWPKAGCKIKETAQVALAYDKAGKDTSAIKRWLLSKNATASEIKWFLEIDIANQAAATCTIKDGAKSNTIQILESQGISGNPGSCFSIDAGGFMLRVNCMDKEFEISCNQDFITTTLYQKSAGGTFFVPSETHSAASSGTTKEKIKAKCFKTSGSCDYEGSLWAALALQNMREDVSFITPYLLAMSDDNQRYFPSAFLYIIAGGDEQYNNIIQSQKQGKFWEMTGGNKFYDTSLAMLALGGKSAGELDAAKSYLMEIQTSDGCWNNNNIRDTAFILYSGWAKSVGAPAGGPVLCEPAYYCTKGFECAAEDVLGNFECLNAGEVCCLKSVQLQTCYQKRGIICTETQECTGTIESSADGSCCIGGSCEEIVQPKDECSPSPVSGTCRISCEENEVESTETCPESGDICCIPVKKGMGLWAWIIILIILIGLATLGIIYRDKLKVWWHRMMERFKKAPAPKPAAPARAMPPGAARPPYYPYGPAGPRAPPRAVSPRDREMEETLKKLREIGGK